MFSKSTRFVLRISCLSIAFTAGLAVAQPTHPAPKPAPTDATRKSLIGMYNGGQMEVGAQMELQADGHFRYELAYGALDEAAEGTWEFKDGVVFLTTVPAVKLPRFVVESDVPDASGGLWIKLSSGAVMEGARQRVFLFYDSNFAPDARPDLVEVGDDGKVPLPRNQMPKFIIPQIPVFSIIPKPIPIEGTGGHRITMHFEQNDIGKADFREFKLTIEDGVLVMIRPDLQLELHFRPKSH